MIISALPKTNIGLTRLQPKGNDRLREQCILNKCSFISNDTLIFLELFCQKQSFVDFLQNRFSEIFPKFHRKALVIESLFKKVAGRKACNFIEKTRTPVFSCEICKNFRSTSFYRTPPVAAFGLWKDGKYSEDEGIIRLRLAT